MSTLRTNNIANVAGTQSTDVLNVINGSAKAWVNFNGTGTVTIRASHNVTSITDNGTGDYTVNFTNAMASINYAIVFGHSRGGTSYTATEFDQGNVVINADKTTAGFGVALRDDAATARDNLDISAVVFA